MNETDIVCIYLPSLIHRIGGGNVNKAKVIAQANQCQLKRIRRSRNWQISGTKKQIDSFVRLLADESYDDMFYLINKIKQSIKYDSSDVSDHSNVNDSGDADQANLVRLLSENPAMTLAELMLATNCTLSEARQARFELEDD